MVDGVIGDLIECVCRLGRRSLERACKPALCGGVGSFECVSRETVSGSDDELVLSNCSDGDIKAFRGLVENFTLFPVFARLDFPDELPAASFCIWGIRGESLPSWTPIFGVAFGVPVSPW
jgi:hypothetical protein